jgi:N-acetylmuramoyl-L-alanine amidase
MKKYLFLFYIVYALYVLPIHEKQSVQYIVILEPTGDAMRTGRRIGDSFERGLTLQCAEKIKAMLEDRAPYIKVIITRLPGDIVYDLQNASLANRIDADLFINLSFYYTQETKPTVRLFQFVCGNDFASYQQGLACNTYDEAYKINKQATDTMCQVFKKTISQQLYQSVCTVAGPYSLPIKSLIGIIAPSIVIEAGLKDKEAWRGYCEPLVEAIIGVFNEIG